MKTDDAAYIMDIDEQDACCPIHPIQGPRLANLSAAAGSNYAWAQRVRTIQALPFALLSKVSP
jgi:hypothetical protein